MEIRLLRRRALSHEKKRRFIVAVCSSICRDSTPPELNQFAVVSVLRYLSPHLLSFDCGWGGWGGGDWGGIRR